jgi:cell division septation protein DedD
MADRIYPDREDRGLSARQLVMLFLGIVTVCAVFFAAGFLVGYNERTSKELPAAERVAPSAVIPPTVNPPANSESGASAKSAPRTAPTEPTPVREERVRTASPRAKPHEEPKSKRASAPKESSDSGRYVIQVAASSSLSDAQEVARGLKARGFPAFVVTPEQAGANDNLYRVQIGPYSTRAAAEHEKPKLEGAGFKSPFIKH